MSKEQAALQIVKAVADAIRELGQVPSGELYARLMDKISLADYEFIISTLKSAGVVSESNNLLTWKGI